MKKTSDSRLKYKKQILATIIVASVARAIPQLLLVGILANVVIKHCISSEENLNGGASPFSHFTFFVKGRKCS